MRKLPSYVTKKEARGRSYYYFTLPRGGSASPKYIPLPHCDAPNFAAEVMRLNAMYPRQRKPVHWEDAPSWIYFIASATGEIKIGRAVSPERRLITLQAGNPFELRLLAISPGGVIEEQEYHRRFAAHRIRGEWFSGSPSIMEEIAVINETRLRAESE